MKKIIALICFSIILGKLSYSNDQNTTTEAPPSVSIPMIPMLPATPTTDTTVDEQENVTEWELEKISTFHLETKVNVIVPLEIITDVEIKALVVDDAKVTVPFELEMNKAPDKKDFYKLNYSETEIDIDSDGAIDTKIYSPTYINEKVVKDNYLVIDGANISKEGVHKKRVYITVELKEEI
ncbi:hypothetical protein [Candidatus Cetobacterium colombiensis]|uniref:Uncharacterized protein n=1 Tax=Candidatus Cetobacterium colombiensis TaxID=3073100 RepID=A0ABU4WDV0_9FUSO|nr:hypothetical protein [Candidatus Cetobacterium colombiensis]MDX8336580.1 hypothetical protein [Candidatus Cetobacterium colombiensis]